MSKDLKNKAFSPTRPDFLGQAAGPVAIRMTNDYLFHAMFQHDNEALKGLVGALLHLKPQQIKSAVITNPIALGDSIADKAFMLDIRLLLNDNAIINIEMQVINEKNWPERSLSYLCRTFNNLNPGDSYLTVKPALHIGLLDFTLFPESPEFYATYRMMNIKNHAIYSDKLCLSVVDLTHIDLASKEDKLYHIDSWASLFKATTWEEIKMIAQNDTGITNAANTVWKLTQEDKIRLQCEAREDYYRRQRDIQYRFEQLNSALAEQKNTIAEQKSTIAELESTIASLKAELERKSV